MSAIVGITHLARAFSIDEFFVGTTVGAAGTVSSGLSAGRADSANSTDSSKTLDADALLVAVVNFVGSTFSGADAELIGVESLLAIAVSGLRVVLRVDGTGDTVSVADEVVVGALLTNTGHESISVKTSASVGLSVEG